MSDPMLDQIYSLPDLIRQAVPQLEAAQAALDLAWAASFDRVFLAGCGDSHFAALAAELSFETLAGLPCEPMAALQFSRYAADFLPAGRNLVAGISVSGEVARTVEALQQARRNGASTLALTGAPGSRLAQAADRVLQVSLAPFPSPPGTVTPGVRSYVGNLLALHLMAIRLGEIRGAQSPKGAEAARAALLALAEAVQQTIAACDEPARALAAEWADADEFVFTGSGPVYGAALFSAAKLLEASGDSALGQDTEEWAHLQYFARAAATPTFILSAGGRDLSRAVEVAVAARAIGRRVIAVAPAGAPDLHAAAGRSLTLHLTAPANEGQASLEGEAFAPLVASVPGALFAAHRAVALGEPYLRGFGGGRAIQGGGGISRIQSSQMLSEE